MSTQDNTSNNKRIAKNTLFLYLRMLLSTIVSLYTSRVVLQTLGVEDFGIYGIVGGVVSMFSFLNAAMSGATSRFLTYEMGKGNGNIKKLNDTFSSAMIIHIMIAITVVIIAETFGLWFLRNKLVIPEGRMLAAHVVYQLSIVSMIFGVTQVPYSATIIAHEKMDIYAYLELIHVFLKLAIVYLLLIGNFDKLILYASLYLTVTVIILMVSRIYCTRHFEESHFHIVWDKTILRPMLSFSGWNMYTSFCVTTKQQGINMLINMFFGVVYNTASSIATTVFGVLQGIAYNVIQAFNPQIIKQYAAGNKDGVNMMVFNSIKYSLLLFLLVAVPLTLELHNVLRLWLGIVPYDADIFCSLLILGQFFGLISNTLNTLISATGSVKKINAFVGTAYLMNLPITYILYRLISGRPEFAYIVGVALNVLVLIFYFYIAKEKVPYFNVKRNLLSIAKIVAVIMLATIFPSYINSIYPESFFRLIIVCSCYVIMYMILVMTILFKREDRIKVYSMIKSKICKR